MCALFALGLSGTVRHVADEMDRVAARPGADVARRVGRTETDADPVGVLVVGLRGYGHAGEGRGGEWRGGGARVERAGN